MGVGHQQPAVAIDRQPARTVHVELGRPPAAQIIAVAVEDLDAVGQVGQVEMVLRVERGGPRLVQMPGLDPVHPPDQIRMLTATAGRNPAGSATPGLKARRELRTVRAFYPR